MLACGTTTCEAKSGYGLTTDSELKQLRVIRALDASHPIDIKATFLGAHALPPEYRDRRADYVSLVVDEMIPRVAEERLADYCDVFCDEGAFTPEEATVDPRSRHTGGPDTADSCRRAGGERRQPGRRRGRSTIRRPSRLRGRARRRRAGDGQRVCRAAAHGRRST